jgi:hypothetical protein
MRTLTMILALVIVSAAGCKTKTETGYAPRTLGDSMTVQRGYYATPFSPEARMAEQARQDDGPERRPDVGR